MTLVHGLLTRQSVRGVGIKEQRRLRLLSVRLHQNTPPINQFYPKLALKRIVNDIHEFLVMEVKHELVPTEESFGVSVNPRDRLDHPAAQLFRTKSSTVLNLQRHYANPHH